MFKKNNKEFDLKFARKNNTNYFSLLKVLNNASAISFFIMTLLIYKRYLQLENVLRF